MARSPLMGRDADEGGQMMMLGAIVLVLGFLALAGMIARVQMVGVETGREQQRPVLREVGPMKEGLQDAISGLATAGYTPGTAAYDSAVAGLMQHMRVLEASRGFLFESTLACAGNPATGTATVTLSDGDLWVSVRLTCERPPPSLAAARLAVRNPATYAIYKFGEAPHCRYQRR